MPDDVARRIAQLAGGDARNALNILELAWQTAQAEGVALEERHADEASTKRPLLYDKGGDQHYDFISAFIKSMRGSDPDAAVYYLAAMIEGGEDARYIARRMIVLASEDIGNADPRALLVAVAAAHAVEHVGLPEARLNLAQAAIYLARAPKSNASYVALKEATADVREGGNVRPPKPLRDASYRGAKKLGHGQGYVYPHDDPRGFERRLPAGRAEGQDVLPAERQRRRERELVGRVAVAVHEHVAHAAEALGRRDDALDVVLGAVEREVPAVPHRPRRARVAVERHAGRAGVHELVVLGAVPAELDVRMPEHERATDERADAQLVGGLRLAREAVDVAPPATVDVGDAVDLGALG